MRKHNARPRAGKFYSSFCGGCVGAKRKVFLSRSAIFGFSYNKANEFLCLRRSLSVGCFNYEKLSAIYFGSAAFTRKICHRLANDFAGIFAFLPSTLVDTIRNGGGQKPSRCFIRACWRWRKRSDKISFGFQWGGGGEERKKQNL